MNVTWLRIIARAVGPIAMRFHSGEERLGSTLNTTKKEWIYSQGVGAGSWWKGRARGWKTTKNLNRSGQSDQTLPGGVVGYEETNQIQIVIRFEGWSILANMTRDTCWKLDNVERNKEAQKSRSSWGEDSEEPAWLTFGQGETVCQWRDRMWKWAISACFPPNTRGHSNQVTEAPCTHSHWPWGLPSSEGRLYSSLCCVLSWSNASVQQQS